MSQPYADNLRVVAGAHNLTVDELLRLLQSPPNLTNNDGHIADSYLEGPRDFASYGFARNDTGNHPTAFHATSNNDHSFFRDFSSQAETQPHRGTRPVQHFTEVQLLNPSAPFACDYSFPGPVPGWTTDDLDLNASINSPPREPSQSSYVAEEDSFVNLTPPWASSGLASGSIGHEIIKSESRESASEWQMVSVGAESKSSEVLSNSADSSDKIRFPLIAPKDLPLGHKRPSTSQDIASPTKIRKKRSPYEPSRKIDTNLTRQMNACVRCRMQRNRCIPDPLNPRGPCQPCQEKTARISKLPCLRYKLADSTLFRTGLDYMPFYKAHPMVGKAYGDFHLENRRWTDAAPRHVYLGQLWGSTFLQLELHEFSPAVDEFAVDLKGRSMYAVPWAIPDPEPAIEAFNIYIDENIVNYIKSVLGHEGLAPNIFFAALQASTFPVPNRMLQKVIRLWVVCRFIESRWECWGDEFIAAASPKDPFWDRQSPPPYLDYQMASIIIERILMPLRADVLRDLQTMMNQHRREDWFVTFLTCYILLHNYELQVDFQFQFAQRRKAPVQYLDMQLVRATNSGAKTILAHFHYCCKGQRPFGGEVNWESAKVQRMARLDPEQSAFMSACRDFAVAKATEFRELNHTDAYHLKHWYTSQLFDPDWVPRDTLEHAPQATW